MRDVAPTPGSPWLVLPTFNEKENLERMVAAARQRGLCLGIDFNHRFTPAARTAKQWQQEGRLGDLLFCNMAKGSVMRLRHQ